MFLLRNGNRERRLYLGPTYTREDAAEGSGFPALLKVTQFNDNLFFSFGILIHQDHTKIIITINISIAITIMNNKTIISIMMMMMTKTRRIYQRKIYL